MRSLVISLILFSNLAFSHSFGTATYKNVAKVKHNGDFIEFYLESSALCQERAQDARRMAIENVDGLTKWLAEHRTNYPGIDYTAELISVGRHPAGFGNDLYSCPGRYFGKQQVKITLNKPEGEQALHEGFINNFFNELQIIVGQLNSNNAEENQIEVKITSIHKGIFEETGEILRLAAKEKARQKATRDFLAFLGTDYQSSWHLQAIEISDVDYDQYNVSVSWGEQLGNMVPGSDAALSTIKLEAITISVNGTFIFHFEPRDHIPQ